LNSLSGNQGNQWRSGTVNVNIGAEFYFIIEGNHVSSFSGDIAIDDILVLPNSHCTVPTTTTTTVATTTLGRYTPLSCNFERDICLWTHDLTASGNWSRHQGQPNDFHTGPHYGKKTKFNIFDTFIYFIFKSRSYITNRRWLVY
jgi:hypothetical protein